MFTLELQFLLDLTVLTSVGSIVWSKDYGRGKYYGLSLSNENSFDETIISELKSRRGKEVARTKQSIKVV